MTMLLRLLVVAVAVVAAACTQPIRVRTPASPGPPQRVLVRSRADVLLERAIAAAEADTSASVSSRLAHLKMTETAAKQLAEGKLERAVDLLERAIAIDGREGFAYFYLARAHLQLGRPRQSLAFAERAAALMTGDAELAAELRALRESAVATLAVAGQ